MANKNIFQSHLSRHDLTRHVWAAGRNYADHAAEMAADVPENPVIFLKAGTSITKTSLIQLPEWSSETHHEIELAFWLDENLNFSHFTLALDLTARQAQSEAKKKGLPWTLAKSFKDSCPLGPWISLDNLPNLESLSIVLKVNSKVQQEGSVSQMIFSPAQLLNYIKTYFPVAPYDVLLTGTPAGVGPLKSGDKLEGLILDKTLSEQQPILVCHWDVN